MKVNSLFETSIVQLLDKTEDEAEQAATVFAEKLANAYAARVISAYEMDVTSRDEKAFTDFVKSYIKDIPLNELVHEFEDVVRTHANNMIQAKIKQFKNKV